MEVAEEAHQRNDDRWAVPARRGVLPARMFDYYEALADAGTALLEQEHLTVPIAPADPEGVAAGS